MNAQKLVYLFVTMIIGVKNIHKHKEEEEEKEEEEKEEEKEKEQERKWMRSKI